MKSNTVLWVTFAIIGLCLISWPVLTTWNTSFYVIWLFPLVTWLLVVWAATVALNACETTTSSSEQPE